MISKLEVPELVKSLSLGKSLATVRSEAVVRKNGGQVGGIFTVFVLYSLWLAEL